MSDCIFCKIINGEIPSKKVLENDKLERLAKDGRYSFWEKYDDSHTIIRFATSWATKMEDVEALCTVL